MSTYLFLKSFSIKIDSNNELFLLTLNYRINHFSFDKFKLSSRELDLIANSNNYSLKFKN